MGKYYATRGAKTYAVFIDANGIHDLEVLAKIPVDSMEVFTAKCFIDSFFIRTKTPNFKFSSYVLKHIAERWGKKMQDNGLDLLPYISNGAFITAMAELGHTIVWHPSFGLNCAFYARWKK